MAGTSSLTSCSLSATTYTSARRRMALCGCALIQRQSGWPPRRLLVRPKRKPRRTRTRTRKVRIRQMVLHLGRNGHSSSNRMLSHCRTTRHALLGRRSSDACCPPPHLWTASRRAAIRHLHGSLSPPSTINCWTPAVGSIVLLMWSKPNDREHTDISI